MAWANANLMAEEFESALSGFDDVLKVFPTHRDALNGKMQAQSYLMRHPDGDRDRDAAARPRHLAHRRRQLLARLESLSPQGIRRGLGRRRERDQGPVEQPRLHARRIDRLRAQGSADRRRALRYAPSRSIRSACDAAWMSGLVSIDQNELAIAGAEVHARHDAASSARRRRCARNARALDMAIQKRGTPAERPRAAQPGSAAARCRHRRGEVGAVGLQRRPVLRAHRRQGPWR